MPAGLEAICANPTIAVGVFRTRHARSDTPAGCGIHDLLGDPIRTGIGIVDPTWIQVYPFGSGPPRSTYALRVWGWVKAAELPAYIPLPLAEVNVELGEIDGSAIAGGAHIAHRITPVGCDTSSDSIIVRSFGNNLPAWMDVNCEKSRWIEFEVCSSAAADCGANAFWRPVQ